MPIIPATQEVETGGSQLRPGGTKVRETLSQKQNISKKVGE
jgi:hypothetical protein